MTERERVLTLLGGGRPDRVPWFGDLDYWATALIGRGLKPRDFKESAAYLDWHRALGVGFYLQGYVPFRTVIEHCRVTERRDGTARRRTIETPHGVLAETWTWLPDSFAEAPTEHLVKSPADLKAYRYVFENTRYEPDYALAGLRRRQAGDIGIVVGYLPKSPFMQMAALDAGIVAVTEIFADDPDELAGTLAAARAAQDRAARIAVDSPAEVLMIPENLSSEVVGPRFYEMFMRDYHEAWTGRIRAAGKFSCVHLDGTLRGLLRQVASAGFTFIEAMTPAPAGDLEVGRWAEWCGNASTVLWGGLPGVYFTDLISDAEFERHVRSVLEVMTSRPRYVLGVADQVPPDGLESRVRRVGQMVAAFGAYRT
ncbi:MAG: uroporphyrinogen decarboxylase family protein [Acidobacteriota bacterium]